VVKMETTPNCKAGGGEVGDDGGQSAQKPDPVCGHAEEGKDEVEETLVLPIPIKPDLMFRISLEDDGLAPIPIFSLVRVCVNTKINNVLMSMLMVN